MTVTVTSIATTPVKGFTLVPRGDVFVGPHGVVDNRRFFLVDGEGNRLRSCGFARAPAEASWRPGPAIAIAGSNHHDDGLHEHCAHHVEKDVFPCAGSSGSEDLMELIS